MIGFQHLNLIYVLRYRPAQVNKMSCENFFPQDFAVSSAIEESANKIKSFIERHNDGGRLIVLVTSGGTTVPLEEKTVRFIDNFSVGTRGSASAENFLDRGYAVVFLHRRGSLQPFNRFFQHQNFLDMFCSEERNGEGDRNTSSLRLKDEWLSLATECHRKYRQALDSDSLLIVDFTSLSDYLYLLQSSAQHLGRCRERAMLYLAAAVSDFYIPEAKISPHKIQSSNGPLQLSLQIVPKILRPLVKSFVPRALVVSFKLETDPSLLLLKSKKALETYNHQVVVGNILETRKREVLIVTKDSERWIRLADVKLHGDEGGADTGEGRQSGEVEIESAIISELADMHRQHLKDIVGS